MLAYVILALNQKLLPVQLDFGSLRIILLVIRQHDFKPLPASKRLVKTSEVWSAGMLTAQIGKL
jgi:hypothetical protein